MKAGQLLATVESAQPASAVAAQQATISSAKTNVDSYIAAEKTAEANVEEAAADLEQKKFDYQRAQELYRDKLIAKQDFDAKKAAYDVDVATLAQRKAAVLQAKAQTASSRSTVNQNVAMLRGDAYSLGLTRSVAPFDGLVTNVPVREGETVVRRHSERRGLDAHDTRRHVRHHRRGQGGRDRHRQRSPRPDRGRLHRRLPERRPSPAR